MVEQVEQVEQIALFSVRIFSYFVAVHLLACFVFYLYFDYRAVLFPRCDDLFYAAFSAYRYTASRNIQRRDTRSTLYFAPTCALVHRLHNRRLYLPQRKHRYAVEWIRGAGTLPLPPYYRRWGIRRSRFQGPRLQAFAMCYYQAAALSWPCHLQKNEPSVVFFDAVTLDSFFRHSPYCSDAARCID